MKTILAVCILLFVTTLSYTQNQLNENQLIGEWEPINAINESGDKDLDQFTEGFKVTIFEFKKDHQVNFQSLSEDYMFKWYLASTKNAKWEIEKETKLIKIGEQSHENAISYINAYKENGKVFFIIDKIKIEVKKI